MCIITVITKDCARTIFNINKITKDCAWTIFNITEITKDYARTIFNITEITKDMPVDKVIQYIIWYTSGPVSSILFSLKLANSYYIIR